MLNYKIFKNVIFIITLIVGTIICFDFLEVKAITINNRITGYYHAVYENGTYSNYGNVLKFTASDGRASYCIEPGTKVNVKENYTVTNVTDEKALSVYNNTSNYTLTQSDLDLMKLYAYFGYGYDGHDTDAYRLATQMLIWRVIDSTTVFTDSHCGSNTNCNAIDDPSDIASAIKTIQTLVENYTTSPDFGISSLNLLLGEVITLTDSNGVLSDYKIDSCTNCTASISGNTLTITATSVGDIKLSFTKSIDSNYSSMMQIATSEEYQNILVVGDIEPLTYELEGTVEAGRLKLTKYDADTKSCSSLGDNSLEGSTYALYDSDGNLVETLTIGSDCTATSGYLRIGNYILKEISTGIGYEIDVLDYDVVISSSIPFQLTVYDESQKFTVDLHKVMSDGTTGIVKGEKDAVFEVYLKSTGKLVTTVTTDANGKASLTLPYGTYIFHQISGAEGYNLSDDVEVDLRQEDKTIYINNAKYTSEVKIIKIDSETKETIAISGIKFMIWSIENNDWVSFEMTYPSKEIINVFATDENGTFYLPGSLGYGTYILYEVDQQLSGYLKNSEGVEFTITKENANSTITVYFENTPIKGQIEVYKKGETLVLENDSYYYEIENLKGVTFEIYAAEDIYSSDGMHLYYAKGDLVDTITTDENGYAISILLPLGNYYIIEIETIDGYILNSSKHYFTLKEIDNNNEIVYETYSLVNYLEKGKIVITKIDNIAGSVIPGALIQIYDEETDTLIYEGYTDEYGQIVLEDLYLGKFYFVEATPPEGYLLNEEKIYFEITENAEVIEKSLTNEIAFVPSTNLDDSKIINNISIIFILLGANCLFYEKYQKTL